MMPQTHQVWLLSWYLCVFLCVQFELYTEWSDDSFSRGAVKEAANEWTACLMDACIAYWHYIQYVQMWCRNSHPHLHRKVDIKKKNLCVQSSYLSKELQFRYIESSVRSSNYIQPVGLSEAQRMFACFFPHSIHQGILLRVTLQTQKSSFTVLVC